MQHSVFICSLLNNSISISNITEESFTSLSFMLYFSRSTILCSIQDTEEEHCARNMCRLTEDWMSIINLFIDKCHMPDCIQNIDGKYCHRCPPLADSLYYNYKAYHSLILHDEAIKIADQFWCLWMRE